MKQKVTLFTSMLIIPALAHAQGTSSQCLSRGEMRSGISYVMPMVLNAAKNACATTLAKGSFLTDGSTDMISKYAALADDNKSGAVALISKFGSKMKFDDMGDTTSDMLVTILPTIIEDELGQEIKPTSCQSINDIVETLAPLPPENMTRLVETIIVQVLRDGDAKKTKDKQSKSAKSPVLCAE